MHACLHTLVSASIRGPKINREAAKKPSRTVQKRTRNVSLRRSREKVPFGRVLSRKRFQTLNKETESVIFLLDSRKQHHFYKRIASKKYLIPSLISHSERDNPQDLKHSGQNG